MSLGWTETLPPGAVTVADVVSGVVWGGVTPICWDSDPVSTMRPGPSVGTLAGAVLGWVGPKDVLDCWPEVADVSVDVVPDPDVLVAASVLKDASATWGAFPMVAVTSVGFRAARAPVHAPADANTGDVSPEEDPVPAVVLVAPCGPVAPAEPVTPAEPVPDVDLAPADVRLARDKGVETPPVEVFVGAVAVALTAPGCGWMSTVNGMALNTAISASLYALMIALARVRRSSIRWRQVGIMRGFVNPIRICSLVRLSSRMRTTLMPAFVFATYEAAFRHPALIVAAAVDTDVANFVTASI